MTEAALKRHQAPAAIGSFGPVDILGPHPRPPSVFAEWLAAKDEYAARIAHRVLCERDCDPRPVIREVAQWLERHHTSRERLESLRRQAEILVRQGFPERASKLTPYPSKDVTRKGNLAEIILAEYICDSGEVKLPVYRLRHNPNIDEPMKGNDVLAFDLDSQPVRIVVGEAKFRGSASKEAVDGILEDLGRSCRNVVPVSLGFVAQMLYQEGKTELADRVNECYTLCLNDAVRLDYVGLLMSDERSAEMVRTHASSEIRRLLVISMGLRDPVGFCRECWTEVGQCGRDEPTEGA
ncbi:MAG: Hachiman antiphage defense system protein HamA [Bacillota bacterium]